MRRADIVVGGVYSDGKKGIRRVVDEGPQYKLYHSVADNDCIKYEVLAARNSLRKQGFMTRTAFASWAKVRIDESPIKEEK